MDVHFVDIDGFDSEVARQFGVGSIPRFFIFDEDGRLVVEGGQPAKDWLQAECDRLVREGM